MSDVNANIGVHIDTSAALAELKALQRQLATFHASIAKNSAASAAAQKGLQTNLLNAINATGQFHAQMGLVRTSTESFTHALENNKLSMREYFRYAGASTKSFGKLFKSEFDTIGKVAEERVRKMQTQYIKMGRDANGAVKAMAITPTTLNMKDLGNQTAVASQKQAIFNQLVKQGSTSLLNFGKNTQWAGRQLMVGFSVPLMYIGSIAGKTFMEMEEQAIRFKRVYGDIFTTAGETEKAVKEIELLAKSFTKYGVALTDTMKMAAEAAAMGKTGAELTAQVAEATRLAVLGGVEQQQALETTISLTNAFGISADQLASKINFLNAVENQTVVSIEDLTIAIPKAGPVIQQLGGDVEDLAFFLTAMKEGGINASEGANALKSGLASLINPTKKASEMLAGFGINISGIVEANAGNLKGTVVGFAQALDTLDPLNRARAIEQLFGKFQFARLSTLFQNITKDGTQANKVLGLTQASVEELAILSQRELKKVEDAVGVNFKQSLEDLKIAIMPIGKTFLEALTPIVKFAGDLLAKFNGLGDGTKKFIVVATTLVGIIGPTLLMTFGLVANGAANIIKLFLALRTGFLKLGGNATVLSQQTSYLNAEQLEAATVAASLNQAHTRLTQSFTLETSAVNALRNAYVQATTAALTFARANPGMMMPGFKGSAPKKFAQGTTGLPGPKGAGDIIPILAAPGEAIIPANVAQNPAYQPIIDAMVNGKIQGFEQGTTGVSFGGKEYNAKTARGATNIKQFLDGLIKNQDGTLTHIDSKTKEATTFSEKRLREVFDYRSQPGKEFTTGDIMRSLNIGSGKRGTSAGTSAPAWVKKLVQDSADKDKTVFAEKEFLKKKLQEKGIALTQAQERNLFGLDAAHVEKDVTPDGKKVWKASNIVPEPGYINKYLNDQVHGKKFGKQLQALPDAELTRLGIDRVELDKLVNEGSHPTNAKSAATLAKIADYQKQKYPGQSTIYQAELASSGIKYRLENGVYGAGLKTLADRFPEAKTSLTDIDPKGIFAQADADVKKSKFKNEPVTKYGQQISQSSGYSFREANHLSGVFEKPDGSRVFVKPMMDEKAALAEQRATIIARDAHGLDAPEQTVRVIQDPSTGKKLFALESPYDPKFAESNFTGKFTKQEYFKQLVAANLRGDRDLHGGNLSGNVLADVGTAGVFEKASGKRDFAKKMPSMEQQANINLLNGATGARKFFAEATLDVPKNMTAEQYGQAMRDEIDEVLPKLKKTISTFDLNPKEREVYQGMITRLEQARKVPWEKFHQIHSNVAVAVEKREAKLNAKGKVTKFTGQNTTALPKGVKPSSKKASDSRFTTLGPGESVVTPSKTPTKTIKIPGKADAPGVSSLMNMDPTQLSQRQAAMQNGVDDLINNTKKTTNRIKELGNKGNVAIGALSGLTIAGTFAGGKLGEMANAAMPFVFGAQGIAGVMSMMPDSMTKMKGGMIAATAVVGTFITVTALLNKTYNDAQNKAMELSEATGASAKAIENFAVFANKATPGQILDERNRQARSPFTTKAGKTSFGEAYVAAPDNQALIEGIKNNLKTNPKTAMQDLTKQLSVAIASGVFTPEQARSVAVNIGEQIGNVGIGLQASAKLTELYGQDGSNLLKDPLTLRVRLMEEATAGISGNAKNLGSAGSAVKGGSLSAMNQNVAVGGTVSAFAGAGALIGSGILPGIGTVAGAAVGAIAAGAALMFTMKQTAAELGRLSGISVQNQQNALNVNKEMSASVQLYYENLIKVKNAEGDIAGAKEAQDKYDKARVKLAEQNAKTVKAIADSYKNTAGNSQKALVDAAKKATGKKYKGTEQEAYVGQAQSALANQMNIGNNGKKGQMEYVLTMQMNAGNIQPSDMMAIIQTFGKSEKSMDKVMTIISKFGGAKAAETQQILGAFVDKNGNPNTKAQTEFLASISTAKTSAEADRLLSLYGSISQNQGILDVGVMVNYFQNNPEAAARLEGLLDNIKKNEGKLTYDVVTNFLPPKGDAAINKEYFDKLNQEQRAVYIQEIATIVSMSEAQIKKSKDFQKWLDLSDEKTKKLPFAQQVSKYADAIGQKVTESRVDLAIATPKPGDGTTPGAGKVRDTTLDELLKKLKFVRDASINAEGKIKDLMNIVSGDGIKKFAGVSQQLMAGTKGGFNREFISMLESMDNKTRDIYMRVEKGKVVLTKQGQALKVAFNEKVIGQFQESQVRSVQDSVAQQAAFVKLKAAGVETSVALEMVADANLAVAINAKKITSTEIRELAKVAVAAKNPVSTLAIELQKVADAARLKMVDVTNQIKILTEAKNTMGFRTEDLKIISEDPVLMKALEKLLNGDGTRQQLGEFENLIKSTINNIKGAKVKVEGDFTSLTEGIQVALQNSASKAQAIFDKLSDDIQKGLDRRRASIEKSYRDEINKAQTAVDEIQKTIDDGYDADKKVIIPGLQSKVDLAQQAIDSANDTYDTLVKSIEDKYFKEGLDNLGNIVTSGLLAGPQKEIDRLNKSIEDLQNKGDINAIGLTQFGAAAAGGFKGNNLTLAEAEKAIGDVEAFIEKTYSRPIEMLQQAIAGQQRTLEINYTRAIEEMQNAIEKIQTKIAKEFDKPLSNIQEESAKLNEDLAVMDKAADAVNDKYTKQEEALSKIAEINQDIVEQQKQQLGLADALSKGDISAAAAAVQDMRATQAAKSLGAQQGTLAKAKEAELAAIKSPSGLTRDQIAERQYALERASYQIQQLQKVEQEKILALQEKIYNIENDPARLEILKNIKLQEDKIYELDNLKLAANNAIYAVQAQITTRNTQIATQQSLLAKAEADLKVVQDKRDAELKAAEITHNAAIVKLTENLTLAEGNLKKANDALVLAQAALKAVEDSRAKAMAEVESDEQKFKDMVAAIDLATESTVLFEDQLKAAKTAADNLKTALENLTKAKDAELKAEIKRQEDAAKAAADLKAKQEADAKKSPTPRQVVPKGALRPLLASTGGMVPKYFASGGFSKGTDTIPAMLTPGEFVIKKSAVDSYGVNNLSKINNGMSPDSSVYNYSLSVSVNGNNLNPDDIANTVIQKIKYIDGQRIRGQR